MPTASDKVGQPTLEEVVETGGTDSLTFKANAVPKMEPGECLYSFQGTCNWVWIHASFFCMCACTCSLFSATMDHRNSFKSEFLIYLTTLSNHFIQHIQ